MEKSIITALLDDWNAALKTENPQNVAALYAPNAVLLPTVSNQVRIDHAGIEDYFRMFIETRAPEVSAVNESHVRTFGAVAVHSGIYTFTLKKGPTASVSARFTFIYHWDGMRWMIVEQHSSQMPE